MLERLSSILGSDEEARIHGVILPALFSAVQAAGRAVRGPQDRAVVLMADDRWRGLQKLLPRWFAERIVGEVRLEDIPLMRW